MENLLNDLQVIESEHKAYFAKNNPSLTKYISLSKKPVMIRFNTDVDSVYRLPDEIYEKVYKLVMSYYGLAG